MTTAWWETNFGELYLRFFQTTLTAGQTDQEVIGVLGMLGLPPGARVLDLCCGQGRHAVHLARAGYRVTGLDRSAYLLAHARQAAQEAGAQLTLVQGDMRRLPWHTQFDACLNLLTAFGYFEGDDENEEVLHQVARSLRPGGMLLLDMANRDYYLQHLWPRAWRREGRAVILEEIDFNAITGRFTLTFTWLDNNGHAESVTHSVRHYTVPELAAMMHRAGFQVEAVYGDFDRRPFELYSKRMIFVARKP